MQLFVRAGRCLSQQRRTTFADGRTLPGLERVLAALASRDPWTQVSFFVNRRIDLDDQSPVDVMQHAEKLAEDNSVDAVVEAAEADVDQGAA